MVVLFVMSTSGVVDAGGPVEHTGHLPSCITGAVAGDPLHGGNQFMVIDAAVVGAGDCAQFNASVLDLKRLDQFGTVRGQPVLKIDGGERGWQLAQIGGRRANHRCELTKAPVRGCKRYLLARQQQRQSLRVIDGSLPP